MRSDSVPDNGSWEELTSKIASSGNKDTIRRALFGEGTASSGMIDASNVLLGGTAAPLGAMMTGESLAAFMGNVAGVDYAAWVKPLQDAMAAYDINTPQRIAAFLAQVKQESGGLENMKENTGRRNFNALWGIQSVFLNSADGRPGTDPAQDAIRNPYDVGSVINTTTLKILNATEQASTPANQKKTLTKMEAWFYNLKAYYEGSGPLDLNGANALAGFSIANVKDAQGNDVIVNGKVKQHVVDANGNDAMAQYPNITWSDEVRRKFADRYLSEDVGTGLPGNGKESDKIAHNWVGRGAKQVTHLSNYAEFFLALSTTRPDLLPAELSGLKDLNAIKAALIANAKDSNIAEGSKIADQVVQSKTLSALSATWFWGTHDASPGSVALNNQASNIKWNSGAVDPTQENEFLKITRGVNGGTDAAKLRWNNYSKNVDALLTGGNPYESMRAALARVGITTVTGKNYTQQFGLTLAAREPVEIEGSKSTNLMAATGEVLGKALSETPDGPDLTAAQEAQLWAQAEPLFAQLKQSPEEKSVMWIPDIWPNAGLLVGAAVAVATSPVQAADKYILGICQVSQPDSGAEISPAIDGNSYLFSYHAGDPRYKGFSFGTGGAKVTLVKAPAHGQVERVKTEISSDYYHYTPKEGYFGQDRFVMQVEKKGVKVRIHYLMEVVRKDEPTTYIGDDGERHGHYCNPDIWKISSTTPALNDARLQALLDASGVTSGIVAAFADLTGGAIGQTTGQSITLDDNAAGWGWFVDATPDQNEEFLPTADPTVWKARPGSEAEGKMDLLSVLLHEYGHALGLEHSADAHDYMASTLQPGVRRLPSAEDQLALMRLTGYVSVPDTLDPTVPTDPFSPFLGTPLLFGIGRLRGSMLGALTQAAPPSPQPSPASGRGGLQAQYQVVPNPVLTNPEFAGNTGWNTTGTVTFGNNVAVLTESAVAQTRLNQLFVINNQDRYLRFTLADIALDDVNAAPDDAFEVALIDANTGLSLLGGAGLTRSDALLNLQANGTEHLASAVTRTLNADGSRTYLIDLSGIAAGTVASLSFDLIGFGRLDAATSSRVTVRDLSIGLGVPETQDDTASTQEDTPVDINALANDLNANQTGFAPVIVTSPAHGQVVIHADGSFGYTPDKDWYGEDSFTYKLSDGNVESNAATVSIVVAPVNDAPVTTDVQATTLEDAPYALHGG